MEAGMTGQALKTDLYQLTMAAAYFHAGMKDVRVTCEAFLRRLPTRRAFLVMAGVPRLIEYLRDLSFTESDIAFLRGLPALRAAMTPAFCDYLRAFRFTGDVWAVPEGGVVFDREPIVRVTGPIIEAQVIETYLLSVLNHAVKVASKAARVVLAAAPAQIIEFGTRRTHDEAAVDAARAAYVAGCAGSANVEAARRHGVPVSGTMAHMFIMAHARAGRSSSESERAAFASFVETFPDGPTLLVDTYDTLRGVDNAIAVAGASLAAVRLDSGDLAVLARGARARLDAAGLGAVRIVASSGLDEHAIAGLVAAGAPIDAYGVGENITEPADAPITGIIYKLVVNHTLGVGVAKRAAGTKSTRPGVKQAWRLADHDLVGLADEEPPPGGRPLLEPAMTDGVPLTLPSLDDARARCRRELAALPAPLRAIDVDPDAPEPAPYPVLATARLEAETERALRS
jgi:nicotinate phosphoribosyltransferase